MLEQIVQKVSGIVRNVTQTEEAIAITASTRLKEDLCVDSLDVLAIVVDLENTFDVNITDDEMWRIKSVEDAVNLVVAKQAIAMSVRVEAGR